MSALAHIDERRLEDYARADDLPPAEIAELLDHLPTCQWCRDRLAEMNEFVAFLHDCPDDTRGQICRRHATAAGTVFLVVTGADPSHWEARAIGGGCDRVVRFRRGAKARDHLDYWFAQTFSDHFCGKGCDPGWR